MDDPNKIVPSAQRGTEMLTVCLPLRGNDHDSHLKRSMLDCVLSSQICPHMLKGTGLAHAQRGAPTHFPECCRGRLSRPGNAARARSPDARAGSTPRQRSASKQRRQVPDMVAWRCHFGLTGEGVRTKGTRSCARNSERTCDRL